jgi:hypothetical protein
LFNYLDMSRTLSDPVGGTAHGTKLARLEAGRTLQALASDLLDGRAPLLREPICMTLGRRLEVVRVVGRQSLVRFPARARGDETTAVAEAATSAPAMTHRRHRRFASLNMLLTLRPHHSPSLLAAPNGRETYTPLCKELQAVFYSPL